MPAFLSIIVSKFLVSRKLQAVTAAAFIALIALVLVVRSIYNAGFRAGEDVATKVCMDRLFNIQKAVDDERARRARLALDIERRASKALADARKSADDIVRSASSALSTRGHDSGGLDQECVVVLEKDGAWVDEINKLRATSGGASEKYGEKSTGGAKK